MPGYVTYETETGRIFGSGSVSEEVDLPLQTNGRADLSVLELSSLEEDLDGGLNDRLIYVVDGELEARPVLEFSKLNIAADGVDEAVLANLPDPCTVVINGEPHEVTGGSLELSADVPATYVVEIRDPFPYQRFRAEVVAT